MTGWRPSVELIEVLQGRKRLEDATLGVQSWARLPIHQAAVEIMALPSKQARRDALARVPEPLQPHVRERVEELWRRRG